MGGLFMVILKNPERARQTGLISTKPQLLGTADWPTLLGMVAQIMSVGGLLVFAFVASWVFGREFSDRTARGLLALQTSRTAIVAAKFAVIAMWTGALLVLVLAIGFIMGMAIGLPGWTPAVGWRGAASIATAGGLTLAVTSPVALAASAGRGDLAGLGWAVLTLVLAQVLAAMGWGAWFPWSVPALAAGVAGAPSTQVGAYSYVAVGLASLAGIAGTVGWWERADHSH
jgi:ABC-2 type transport system permease protein